MSLVLVYRRLAQGEELAEVVQEQARLEDRLRPAEQRLHLGRQQADRDDRRSRLGDADLAAVDQGDEGDQGAGEHDGRTQLADQAEQPAAEHVLPQVVEVGWRTSTSNLVASQPSEADARTSLASSRPVWR